VIESQSASVFGLKTVASFLSQFDFGVQALGDTAGVELFRLEVVQEQGAAGTGDAGFLALNRVDGVAEVFCDVEGFVDLEGLEEIRE